MKLKNTAAVKPTHTHTHTERHRAAILSALLGFFGCSVLVKDRKREVCVCACTWMYVCVFNGGKSDAPRAQLRPSATVSPCFHSNPLFNYLCCAALHSGCVFFFFFVGKMEPLCCMCPCVFSVHQCLCERLSQTPACTVACHPLHPNVWR